MRQPHHPLLTSTARRHACHQRQQLIHATPFWAWFNAASFPQLGLISSSRRLGVSIFPCITVTLLDTILPIMESFVTLQQQSLADGCRVQLQGIASRPEINGCRGIVIGEFDTEKLRWPVLVMKRRGRDEEMLLRPVNLVLLAETDTEDDDHTETTRVSRIRKTASLASVSRPVEDPILDERWGDQYIQREQDIEGLGFEGIKQVRSSQMMLGHLSANTECSIMLVLIQPMFRTTCLRVFLKCTPTFESFVLSVALSLPPLAVAESRHNATTSSFTATRLRPSNNWPKGCARLNSQSRALTAATPDRSSGLASSNSGAARPAC